MTPRIVFLILGTFATGTNALIMTGVLPQVADGLHTTEAVAGIGVTVFSLAYAISAPLLPAFLARFDRRTIMAIALAGFLVGTVASMLAQDPVTFIVTRALVGFAAAAYTPQASAVAVLLAKPEHRGRAITLVLLGISGATAVGVPLGTLIGSTLGWRASFGLVAVLGTIALVGLLGVPATPRPAHSGLRAQLAPFGRPAVLAIAGTTTLMTIGFFAITIYFAPLLAATAGIDSAGLSIVLSIFGVTGIVALLAGGGLIDRFGGFRVAAVAIAVTLAGSLALGVASTFWIVVAVVVPWGLFGNLIMPSQQYELSKLDTDNPAPVFALNMSALFLGTALGGILGSIVLANAPANDLVLVAAVPLTLALAVTLVQVGIRRRRTRGPVVTTTPETEPAV